MGLYISDGAIALRYRLKRWRADRNRDPMITLENVHAVPLTVGNYE